MITTLSMKPSVLFVNATADRKSTEIASSYLVHNNDQLRQLTEVAQSSLNWRKVRAGLDGAISAAIAYFTEPTGEAPKNFPLFSFAGYSGADILNNIRIKQNHVKPETPTEFLHLFRRVSNPNSGTLEFEYHNRQKAVELFSTVRTNTVVSEFFGTRREVINLPEPEQLRIGTVSNLMTENHEFGLLGVNKSTDTGQRILNAKHMKYHAHPIKAEQYIRAVIIDLQKGQFAASREEVKYLTSLIISLKLDLAFVLDRSAAPEVLDALSLARQLDDKVLIANCQRFATQCLDMSNEAIAMLQASCSTLREYPEYTDENGHILPSLFGSLSNLNTTKLTLTKSSIDAPSMENDYMEARTRLPSYENMALIGNAAAVGYMVQNKFYDAVRVLEKCINENAEHTDRLNMYCNLLIAQKMESCSYNDRIFENLVEQLSVFEKGPNWEYLKVRMSLNLMRIASEKDHHDMAENIAAKSSFWKKSFSEMSSEEAFWLFLKERFPYYFEGSSIKGGIGEFIHFNKLFPSVDKDYT